MGRSCERWHNLRVRHAVSKAFHMNTASTWDDSHDQNDPEDYGNQVRNYLVFSSRIVTEILK